MYTARIVVLANARRLGGLAVHLVNGSDDKPAIEPVLQQPAIDAFLAGPDFGAGQMARPVTEVTTRIPDMKCRANKRTMRVPSIGAFLFSTLLAMACALSLVQVQAAEDSSFAPGVATVGPAKSRFLPLGIGKSVVIDLPREAKDVLVADPKIANAIIRSPQRAYIIGGAVGQTNVVFFDADGQQVAGYDIAVKRDLNGIRAALRQSLPGVQIEGVGEGVVLTGSVSSPIEAQQAGDIAARLVGSGDKVVNSIVVRGRDQVMLKVHVAEVRRDIIKQLGIDLSASMNAGTAVVNFNNSNPFTALGSPLVSSNALSALVHRQGLAHRHRNHARNGERRRLQNLGRAESDCDFR
jgi:pilus assembly protein CpaC